MNVSPHFTVDEFDSHDGTDYPPEWIDERLRPLCRVLETIRAHFGGAPVRILSGYRAPEYNERLRGKSGGVAKNSQHVQGRAADFTVKGYSPEVVHAAVLELYKAGKLPDLGGVGVYPRWVHVDVRERVGGHLARWTGGGFGSEPIA